MAGFCTDRPAGSLALQQRDRFVGPSTPPWRRSRVRAAHGDRDDRPAGFGAVTDASVVLALLTLATYASGFAFRDAYVGYWRLPSGEPSWETVELIKRGVQASAAFCILFVIWLAAAFERRAGWRSSRGRQTLHRTALFVPAVFFGFVTGRIGMLVGDLGQEILKGESWPWLLFVMLGAATITTAFVAVIFTRAAFRGDSLVRSSRVASTAVISLVAFSLTMSSALYGGMLGEAEGRIDASGDSSTLLRITFTFVSNSSGLQQEWRLLAHSAGTYYVFDFLPEHSVRGRPTVFLIPDSAILDATLTPR